MDLQLTYLGLVVKDIPKSTEFYTQKLGLKVNEAESIPYVYTQFAMAGDTILSLIGGFEQEGIKQTFDFGMLVADVDATYQQWQAAGVELIGEPHTMPFGRTFHCRTPDGHVLRVYSRPAAK